MNTPDIEAVLEQLSRARHDFNELVRELSDIPFAAFHQDASSYASPLTEWWREVCRDSNAEVTTLFGRLVEHGRVIFQLAERLVASKGADEDLMVLLASFQRNLDQCLRGLDGGEAMFSPVSHLFERWQQEATHWFGITPGTGAVGGAGPEWPAALAAGHPRHAVALGEAMAGYQEALNAFARLVIPTCGDALSRMEKGLAATAGQPIGVREFHALWLECGEAAYDELINQPRFAESLAALINAAVRLAACRQALADDVARVNGMPTRGEVRALARALQDTRRELRRSRQPGSKEDRPAPGASDPGSSPPTVAGKRPRAAVAAAATAGVPNAKAVTAKRSAKKATTKKVATKKTATKKTTTKKATTKKVATKKTAAKKTATKKVATKKIAASKSATKKTATKKSATRKAATKKTAAKKAS